MSVNELTKSWQQGFQYFNPIAHELKHSYSERWFRIHTLPDSKRYAESNEEYKEICDRHNMILSDLIGVENPFFLLTANYRMINEEPTQDKRLVKLNLQSEYWRNICPFEDSPEIYWDIYFDELIWKENSLNDLLCLVADEEISNVIFFSARKNLIYHPYDGGADIILETTELRDFYKNKYKIGYRNIRKDFNFNETFNR